MYQTLRSVSDHHVFVVYRDGSFYELVPEEVRKQGPWQGMRRGEIELLKAEYRLALARHGYALMKCELAVFKPETRSAVTCSKARGCPFLFRPSPRHRRDRNPTILFRAGVEQRRSLHTKLLRLQSQVSSRRKEGVVSGMPLN